MNFPPNKCSKIPKNSMEYLRLKQKIMEEKNILLNKRNSFYHPFSVKKDIPFSINNTINYNKNNTCITVAILTHERTNVACAVIDYLVKNLKYNNLKWCISDDRSTEKHINTLIKRFAENGIDNVKILKTTNEHYGLGASLNNALKYAWNNGNMILTVEDDWILQKELDLEYYAKILQNDENLSMIRLAYLDARHALNPYNDVLDSVGQSTFNYIFNNQCALRHRRIYDLIGYNRENCPSDKQEEDQKERYNSATNFGKRYKVLFPKKIKKHTFDDPSLYFIHVGKSTNGHSWYNIPERYEWIYGEKWLYEINNSNPYPIALITDDKYTENVSKMIRQIRLFSNTKIYVLCWNRNTLKQFNKNDYNNIEFIVIDNNQRKKCVECAGDLSFKKTYFVPPVGLIKFLIPELLKNESRVLYMDCDIIIKQNFTELLYVNVDNYYCGAVLDPYKFKGATPEYPVMNRLNKYFNSGVLLLNLEKMRKENIIEKLFLIKKDLQEKQFMDQDTINICLQDHIKELNNKYNCLAPIIKDLLDKKIISISQINTMYNKSYRNYGDIEIDAVFIHCAGAFCKPWINPMFKSKWVKL